MHYVDHKYIGLISSRLELFKRKNDNLYNFRCPFCGDSQKNKLKARGYFFNNPKTDAAVFKCHNCGDSRSLGYFIKDVDTHLYQKYLLEKFKGGNATVKRKKSSKKLPFKFGAPKFKQKDLLEDVIGAERLDRLALTHEAIRFADGRKIPKDSHERMYYVPDSQCLEKVDPKYRGRIMGRESRILLPFYNKQNELVGITARAINNANTLRYLTFRIGEDDPLVFGLERVNENERIYVVEGPIDSLFIRNSLAVGGAEFGRMRELVDRDNCTIIFDNEPRGKEIVQRMRTIIDAGFDICIWAPANNQQKDINDMVMAGMSPDEIVKQIDARTFSGLSALAAFNEWKKV
jgi:predicted RNA-binding Zn-ribbon protein involved in translation (DUF1610 family)